MKGDVLYTSRAPVPYCKPGTFSPALGAMRVGGIPEVVRPGMTGYLAEPENAKDFSDGIVQLLEDNALRGLMKQQCREIALKEYPFELQLQRYIALYRRILEENGKGKSV